MMVSGGPATVSVSSFVCHLERTVSQINIILSNIQVFPLFFHSSRVIEHTEIKIAYYNNAMLEYTTVILSSASVIRIPC